MMERGEVLRQTAAYAREGRSGEAAEHDWWHVDRVRRMALRLAAEWDGSD